MKQHFIKYFLASMLLAVAPFVSVSIAVAEDEIPDEILALLPSDDGDSDENDTNDTELPDADIEVVIMSDDESENSSDSSSDSGSGNNAGFAEGTAVGDEIPDEILALLPSDDGADDIADDSGDGASGDEIPDEILALLPSDDGDSDDFQDDFKDDDFKDDDFDDFGDDDLADDDSDDSGDGESSQDLGLTDDLIWQFDEVAFSPEFHDRKGNGPALQTTITQEDLPSMSLTDIRRQGALVYTTPMRHADGHGDGPGINPDDPTSEAVGNTGRPTLQGNGTFLRVNGMDTQTCQECHGVINNSVIPAIMGVAGQGGISASPMFRTKNIDVDDSEGNSLEKLGIAFFDGRLINPPKNLGMGGVELGGQEVTKALQRKAKRAQRLAKRTGKTVRFPLVVQGGDFGFIIAKPDGELDTSLVAGVDADLVVRPFGRKGEFDTVRAFDVGAMVFHIGMQAVDEFGPGDPDGDGIEDELTTGEMSALHIFLTTTERPFQEKLNKKQRRGKRIFNRIGCTFCHTPTFNTRSPILEYRVSGGGVVDRDQEPYFSVDLSSDLGEGGNFEKNRRGGIKVPIFSNYKRYNMGPRLAETAHFLETPDCNEQNGTEITNCNFIAMKLWGLADTAPYLHDGRALTIFEAIAFHGGEAQQERDRFLSLSKGGQNALLSFLGTLKNPVNPNQDVLNQVQLDP